jgi:hypothetical protein
VAGEIESRQLLYYLNQWFSTSLMLQSLNTIPHVVVTPAIKLFLLLLHNCNFDSYELNVNMFSSDLWWPLWKGHLTRVHMRAYTHTHTHTKGVATHRLNAADSNPQSWFHTFETGSPRVQAGCKLAARSDWLKPLDRKFRCPVVVQSTRLDVSVGPQCMLES